MFTSKQFVVAITQHFLEKSLQMVGHYYMWTKIFTSLSP
jgi:hypothetical protein